MRSFRSTIRILASCAATLAVAAPFESLSVRQAETDKVGSLAVYWKTNETGVFFALSTNDDPLAFTDINDGKPIFVPTLGQKTVRDVSLIPGSGEDEATKWYLIATDLNINDYSSWDAASANGSKALLVWDSTDLINWTDERLITVEDETAGMVWAPDAIWDPSEGKYLVHWASKFFAENDTAHANGAITNTTIQYAHTSDFQTFTAPQTYLDLTPENVIDLAFLKINDTAYVRQYVTDGVLTDVGYDGLFGSYQVVGEKISGYEGPYPFWDNTNHSQAYLYTDKVGGDAGIRGFGPSDPTTGLWVQDTSVDLTYMRHGSVLALTQEQYDALSAL
ncbi:hypothetical protein MPH_12774 [Macrophomina phaseolina MS6]|uniref:Glycoside hydrolase family 43 n=1 Tax=Macrophomina phaseolina (strain MS6) TaxID=1126212 RepID=K2RJ86_MACPH|nr:hypothetical protein MPH_12774 [Macrophomina phaseolina MS6]